MVLKLDLGFFNWEFHWDLPIIYSMLLLPVKLLPKYIKLTSVNFALLEIQSKSGLILV